MQYEEVQRRFKKIPFEPLLVRMVGGTEYEVRTPESTISKRYAAFLLDDGTIETVALEYIEAVRPWKPESSHRGGNGRRKH